LQAPELERKLGIEVFASRSPGIGGRIRHFPEDFVVEEILIDGSKAAVSPAGIHWPRGRGRNLICLLVKRDWDTLRAVKTVAERLGINHERISAAGLKDARALTAQHISISRMLPEQVEKVRIRDITLRPLRFSDEKLFSKHLFGNEFHITIRAMTHKASGVNQRVKRVFGELSTLGGVPNFFGHQRFGTVRPITHLVGRSIVWGDWGAAALTFLTEYSPYEHPESREARQQLAATRDFEKALHYFPSSLNYERDLLRHLAKRPNDFAGAFRRLPRKLCKLFVQAYQSYLYNRFLSSRIRCLSLTEVYVGDYVVNLGKRGLATGPPKETDAQALPEIGRAVGESQMRVCLPLIGVKQGPSGGVQGELEQEILEAENVTPQDFYVSSMPKISAAGRMRPVLASVMSLSMETASEDSTIPLTRKAGLNFTLHRGSYATVVLREFMKPVDLLGAGF
jgi:tRNA pseudouridine13 synthase